jgi:ribosomal protein L18E
LLHLTDLGRLNKEAIVSDFEPFIQSPSHVIGLDEIEDIIEKNEDLEKRHYKLWIYSATMLETIYNQAVIGRSRDKIESMLDFSQKYVLTQDYDVASQKLHDLHVVIITGEAGIGKTTLAYQLCLYYIKQGYEFTFLYDRIEEAEGLFRADKMQIFFFDDFLGRNYLDALEKNEDSRIANFIQRVSKDVNKRFVLTSRTTILNQCKELSDFYYNENINRNEYEIQLKILSRLAKAKILYNHIWFSKVDQQYIDQLYVDQRYMKVITHKKFNPRVISYITDPLKIANIHSANYWHHVVTSLDNPKEIWSHVFDNQLDPYSRELVCLVVFNGKEIEESRLNLAFQRLTDTVNSTDLPSSIPIFERLVRVCVGSVLNRILNSETGVASISLFNPSIGDYLLDRLKSATQRIMQYCVALKTCESIRNLQDLLKSDIISQGNFREILNRLIETEIISDVHDPAYALELGRALISQKILMKDKQSNIQQLIELIDWRYLNHDDYFSLLTVLCGMEFNQFSAEIKNRTMQLVPKLVNENLNRKELVLLADLARHISEEDSVNFMDIVKSNVKIYYYRNFDSIIFWSGILDDYYEDSELDTAMQSVYDRLQNDLDDFPFEFDDDDFFEIASTVEVSGVIEENRRSRDCEDKDSYDRFNEHQAAINSDDAAIHDLFERTLSGC